MLKVDPKAHQWFEEELEIKDGEGVHIFGKGYGNTNLHEGVSVGIAVDTPHDVLVQNNDYRFPYFITEHDDWLIGDGWLEIKYDDENNEPVYYFHETKESLNEPNH